MHFRMPSSHKTDKRNWFFGIMCIIEFIIVLGWGIVCMIDQRQHIIDKNISYIVADNDIYLYTIVIILTMLFFCFFSFYSMAEENVYLLYIGCTFSYGLLCVRVILLNITYSFTLSRVVYLIIVFTFLPIQICSAVAAKCSYGYSKFNYVNNDKVLSKRYNNWKVGEAFLIIDFLTSLSIAVVGFFFIQYSVLFIGFVSTYLFFSIVFVFIYIKVVFHLQNKTLTVMYIFFHFFLPLYLLYKTFTIFWGYQLDEVFPFWDNSDITPLTNILLNLCFTGILAMIVRIIILLWLLSSMIWCFDEKLTVTLFQRRPPLEIWHCLLGISRKDLDDIAEDKKRKREKFIKERKVKLREKAEQMKAKREKRLSERALKRKKKEEKNGKTVVKELTEIKVEVEKSKEEISIEEKTESKNEKDDETKKESKEEEKERKEEEKKRKKEEGKKKKEEEKKKKAEEKKKKAEEKKKRKEEKKKKNEEKKKQKEEEKSKPDEKESTEKKSEDESKEEVKEEPKKDEQVEKDEDEVKI